MKTLQSSFEQRDFFAGDFNMGTRSRAMDSDAAFFGVMQEQSQISNRFRVDLELATRGEFEGGHGWRLAAESRVGPDGLERVVDGGVDLIALGRFGNRRSG